MKLLLFIFFLNTSTSLLFSQNSTEVQQTADFYIKKVLLGENITVGKVTHVGLKGMLGQFQCDSTITGLSKGIALSTGKITGVFQQNSTTEYTSYGYQPDRTPLKGDSELDKIAKGKSQDASVVEFDFVPVKNTIEFRYVFASEEYNEYVGSEFNDVFGFFLSGPGIEGNKNLAVLEDETPISVNTINLKRNPAYFIDNSYEYYMATRSKKGNGGPTLYHKLEFDGLTTVLLVKHEVIPYEVYHLKIAIADVADEFLDSGVFLEATSFSSVEEPEAQYFEKIAEYENKVPNIDSLLYKENYVSNTVSQTTEQSKTEAEKFKVTNTYFDFNSTTLNEEAKNNLTLLADYLKRNKNKKCSMVGYTDNVGTQAFNQKLSEDRAKQVIDFLISQGVDATRLKFSGKSFANPIKDNTSEAGRAQNRRVEITLED